MDIKITFDVTPKLADLAERVCNAGLLVHRLCDCCHPKAFNGDRFGLELDTPENASDLPVETPEPSPVSKPVEPPKSEPDAKIESPAAAIDETPAPDIAKGEIEPSKPKRSHHKKAEAQKPEPQLEPEKPAEPAEPEPEKPAEPEPVESPAELGSEPETDAAPKMTLDEVRAVCVQAAKAGKTKVVTDFLGAHNAQSLSKLDPKHYAKLAEIVKAAL